MIIPAIGIGPLGSSEWSVGGVSGAGTSAASTSATAPTDGKSFGDALSNAIGSLETTQANATEASQQLATGQLTDPTQAITAVENASLSMDFASQIRNQIDTSATTLFQTQL
ncbi:MAG TPA: flagellar hook-basal body complex protein FliE [Solirubrobacteraceae bacterium]|nr:flagellar hook-basal body complex protein FliE [Solirubrobacteraceae bacterium]